MSYKVGVFDSGIGGLSVLAEIIRQAPDIELHYFADDKFAPYGNLSINQLKQRVMALCEFFIQKEVDAIVIACNTATVSAIEWVRNSNLLQQFSIPVIGIEPAVKPASAITQADKVTVLATPVTSRSVRLHNLIQQEMEEASIVGKTLEFDCLESHSLAFHIDSLPQTEESIEAEVLRVKQAMQSFNSDTLVLACTHYPLIKSIFERHLESHITILEPSLGVTNQLLKRLRYNATDLAKHEDLFLYSSGEANHASRLLYWLDRLNVMKNTTLIANVKEGTNNSSVLQSY